jgi:N-acetylglucosaminyldiphosphoundecaprenol N-acetyl-beta-D-mannosaminyltransferase
MARATIFEEPAFEDLPSADVLGYRVARCTLEEAASWALGAARQPNTPKLLVTLNPEIVVRAEADPELKAALHRAELTVADGVGITWAARRAGTPLPERVPGVELMTRILEKGGPQLRVYFLGAKPGVAQRAAETACERYGTVVAGTQHGYFKRPDEVAGMVGTISTSGADILLAGLGEGQELFLHRHRAALKVPLLMGVGGALDVLSGEVRRTPAWTRHMGLEWAYRVGFDRQRWHRAPRLVRFVKMVTLGR